MLSQFACASGVTSNQPCCLAHGMTLFWMNINALLLLIPRPSKAQNQE